VEQYNGCFDHAVDRRYPHVGGYLANRDYAIAAFEQMLTLPRQTWDDCWNWMDAWKEGWFRPVLDSECEIFYVADKINIEDGRVKVGYRRPNVIHLTGGHVDREGYKDYKLEPVAKELGIV